jgi:hypothetical protein
MGLGLWVLDVVLLVVRSCPASYIGDRKRTVRLKQMFVVRFQHSSVPWYYLRHP